MSGESRTLVQTGLGANDDSNEDLAETEYANFQGTVANMMTMGTLLFGFCATGTFLSIQFTGDEAWPPQRLVDFVRFGMYSAISSLTATMMVFVFSTRASKQHMKFGAACAMRTVRRSSVFFIGAEILIYFSLHEFMSSIQTYARMEYVGPKLCPSAAKEFSFCSQTAKDLYKAAQSLCGTMAPTTCVPGDEDVDWHECARNAVNSTPRAVGESHYACTTYDYYSVYKLHHGTDPTVLTRNIYFTWDKFDSGYEALFGADEDDDDDEGAEDDAFFGTLTVLSNQFCGKSITEGAVAALCASDPSSAACAQAKLADFAADDCAGKKQDDTMKCTKVCQWIPVRFVSIIYDWQPIKTVITSQLDWWMTVILWLIKIMMFFRGLAGLIEAVDRCRTLFKNDDAILMVLDVFGLFDVWDGYRKKKDMETDDAYLSDEC